ncbi:MAG TPA: class I SAM-dependent methyltransferase [Pyrinomonadaceae bacterium]|nr:class I SAM-dependent methyltransferase [Pyrinomonadaceae bacterium]
MKANEKYVPALGLDWLTPLYDPVVKWLMPESKFKGHLVSRARIQPGQRVLDVGCGTATLTLLVKQTHPGAEVFGLDGDAKILGIARRKAAKAGVALTLVEGMAFRLPYADASFDRVLSSMMFHHLRPENKRLTLAEAFRVLRPGGGLHVADFRKTNESLPSMLREAGFGQVEEYAEYRTLFGRLALWQARRP